MNKRDEARFIRWFNKGIRNKWITATYCETHEGPPFTEEEMEMWENGEDPCCFSVRIIPDMIGEP